MNYYEKYLKYKTKYINLKNLLGGDYESLQINCESEIKINKYENCIHCYYQYTSLDNGDDQSKSYSIRNPEKSFSNCTLHKTTKKYFDINDILEMKNFDDRTSQFDLIPDRAIYNIHLLNPDIFRGIKSIFFDSINKGRIYKIGRYPETIDTLCAEGNLVWVNKESKVGTTGIDSCMFVVIILEDESKICIHHNLNDEIEFFNIIGPDKKYFNFSYKDNLRNIIEQSTIGPIRKIYLIGEQISISTNIELGVKGYDDLIPYYNSLAPDRVIKIPFNGNFIINNNNEIIKIESTSI
jgi:hypothetical protein